MVKEKMCKQMHLFATLPLQVWHRLASQHITNLLDFPRGNNGGLHDWLLPGLCKVPHRSHAHESSHGCGCQGAQQRLSSTCPTTQAPSGTTASAGDSTPLHPHRGSVFILLLCTEVKFTSKITVLNEHFSGV